MLYSAVTEKNTHTLLEISFTSQGVWIDIPVSFTLFKKWKMAENVTYIVLFKMFL